MAQWADSLTFADAKFSAGEFTFTYQLDARPLEIKLTHSRPTSLPNAAVQKIAFNLGMCYLLDLAEIVLPKHVHVYQQLPPAMLSYWRDLYQELVVEKCYQAKLPTSLGRASWTTGTAQPGLGRFTVSGPQDHVALALTGGKESLAILKTLEGKKPLLLFFLNPEMNAHRRRLYDHVKDRFLTVKTSSNRLAVLNPLIESHRGLASGVDMAHIVFNTMLYADTCSSVLLGNEYSANFPNAIYEGSLVNHQYVKTIRFAERLNDYIHTYLTQDFTYHSPFFGLYEYRIADLLFKNNDYLDFWTSCNRYTDTVNFCSNCHKCAFTYLLARTKKSEAYLAKFFSRNLLDDVGLFRPLMDFVGEKPLDCVGDKTEVWVALEDLYRQGVTSAVGDYYELHIRPEIAGELARYRRQVSSAQRVPVTLPEDLERIFTQALAKTANRSHEGAAARS